MPIYEMECESEDCGVVFEAIAGFKDEVECPVCGFFAKRLISVPGVNVANQDAEWIRSIPEVVDKESSKPETREFLKSPTRHNMKEWMKAEGIRHYEQGERMAPRQTDTKAIERDVFRRYTERTGMSI